MKKYAFLDNINNFKIWSRKKYLNLNKYAFFN